MTIKSAINKASNHGWDGYNVRVDGFVINENPFAVKNVRNVAEVVLDPEFWKALAKAEGWAASGEYMMIEMAKRLAKGGTIQEYFNTLTPDVH